MGALGRASSFSQIRPSAGALRSRLNLNDQLPSVLRTAMYKQTKRGADWLRRNSLALPELFVDLVGLSLARAFNLNSLLTARRAAPRFKN